MTRLDIDGMGLSLFPGDDALIAYAAIHAPFFHITAYFARAEPRHGYAPAGMTLRFHCAVTLDAAAISAADTRML